MARRQHSAVLEWRLVLKNEQIGLRFGELPSNHPKNPRSLWLTVRAAALSSRPMRGSIRPGSMHAIFAGRTTDGAGSPARLRSAMGISLDHGSLSALVIIATQTRPWIASLRLEITNAGRRFSASRSA